MPNAPRGHKIRSETRRTGSQLSRSKPISVKDLLSKVGLSEKQITQTHDKQENWHRRLVQIVPSEWATAIVAVQFDNGQLKVRLRSAALAARVKLTLDAALIDGLLVLPDTGQAARTLKIEVSR